MASSSYSTSASDGGEEDEVVVECREQEDEADETVKANFSEITISTAQISSWNLPAILSHQAVRVKVCRSRLIELSSYFRGLLSGSFSESSRHCVTVRWSLETFVEVLRFIHGYRMEITPDNLLSIHQAALYFGVEILLVECRTWFSDYFTVNLDTRRVQLDDLVRIWNYGLEQGADLNPRLCTGYIARNFMWAISCDSFIDIPYNLLLSCIKHPHLTVDSERCLAEALLSWIYAHVKEPGSNPKCDSINILNQIPIFVLANRPVYYCNLMMPLMKEMVASLNHKYFKIRNHLLPLWFLMGKQRCQFFSGFAMCGIDVISSQIQESSKVSMGMPEITGLTWKIRLTEFTKILDLSGCPQINAANLMFSLLPDDLLQRETPRQTTIDLKSLNSDFMPRSQGLLQAILFKSVEEVDLSKCPKLHLPTIFDVLRKSFASLRVLKAAYFVDLKIRSLQKMLQNHPSLQEVDLTVDINPILPSKASVLYSEMETSRAARVSFSVAQPHPKKSFPNMIKLTLRGRTDITDSDLNEISGCLVSLCHLDIKGCLSLTDVGISNLLCKCIKLHSIIACNTLFGNYSTSALCNRVPKSAGFSVAHLENKDVSDVHLRMLHIGGCKGIDEAYLLGILSVSQELTSLCLRDTNLVDSALFSFTGSSLKKLNVSNTMISGAVLSHVSGRNPNLKCIKARGCKGLSQHDKDDDCLFINSWKTCFLEEFAIGWGFSCVSLNTLGLALRSLRSLTVGLGASIGEEGLILLTVFCPMLESITLLFQVVSDDAVINLMQTLRKLRTLELSYCMGDLSPLCFKFSMPSLSKLKLERVTPWMTNQELTLLTRDFPNLVELSLIGCRNLDADSQQIISDGWIGLTSLCLEDCGGITSKGICSLFNCKALENLLLRHNGPGINRTFILDAVSVLPMLRSISLDWCDANEGDFDLPLRLLEQRENFKMQVTELHFRATKFGRSKKSSAQGNTRARMEQLGSSENCCKGKNLIT